MSSALCATFVAPAPFAAPACRRSAHAAASTSSAPVSAVRGARRPSGGRRPVATRAIAAPGLTSAEVAQFERDGYLVIPGFASPEDLAALRSRMDELVAGFDPQRVRSIFSTRDQRSKTDDYFLRSGNAISFFFEEEAFGPDGSLQQDKALSINKVGHALHDLDPVFRRFSRSPRMAAVMRSLGFRRPVPAQSMYIFKQPGIGGEVVPHQDSTFLYTEPEPTCVGLWLALEDNTRDSGCMWAEPGSHRQGVHQGLYKRFVLRDGQVTFVSADPSTPSDQVPAIPFEESAFVPLECPAGTLVVLHGAVLHYSKKNTSPRSRHAYAMHFVEGAEGFTWSKDNWLQRDQGFPFESLY